MAANVATSTSTQSAGHNGKALADQESDGNIQSTTMTDQQISTPPTRKPPRGVRTTRKFGTQSTTLEVLDDSMGPLGPLGGSITPDQPPLPPQKESGTPTSSQMFIPGLQDQSSTKSSSLRGLMESVNLEDNIDDDERSTRPRQPPPVQPQNPEAIPKRNTPGGISIEQAAKPSFDVSVGDPHKVGDLTSSHTVYQVRTKVGYKHCS